MRPKLVAIKVSGGHLIPVIMRASSRGRRRRDFEASIIIRATIAEGRICGFGGCRIASREEPVQAGKAWPRSAHERIYQRSLPLEDARAQAAYGQHSQVGKILEIHAELPGRIHVVLIRQQVGY